MERCRVDLIRDRQRYIMFRKKKDKTLVNERVKIYRNKQKEIANGKTRREKKRREWKDQFK